MLQDLIFSHGLTVMFLATLLLFSVLAEPVSPFFVVLICIVIYSGVLLNCITAFICCLSFSPHRLFKL